VRIARGESGASFTAVGASSRNASSKNRVVRITGRLAGVERSAPLSILDEPRINNPVEILQFSAAPSTISSGEQVVLTFRLDNAKAARIEPEVGALSSLVSGTVNVSPQKPTEYFLIATGPDGKTTRKVAFVNVTPSPPRPPRFNPPALVPTGHQTLHYERLPRDIKPTPTPVIH
jgi:hypothetical protein